MIARAPLAVVAAGLCALLAGAATPAPAPAGFVWCRNGVAWQQAGRSVGSVVWLRGRVARARFALDAPGRPTYIDVGSAYPSPRRVTVLIRGRSRLNFPRPPQRMFSAGRLICAHGIVTRHRGAPEIEVEFWDPGADAATF